MLPGDSDRFQGRKLRRFAPRLHVKFRAETPYEFRSAPSVGSMPVRKSRLLSAPLSHKFLKGSGGAGRVCPVR